MDEIPGFLLGELDITRSCPLDDGTASYQPLLGSWLIQMAVCLGWARKPSRHLQPEIFADEDFCAVTGIEPLCEVDEDGDLVLNPGKIKRMTDGSFVRRLTRRLKALHRQVLPPDLPLFGNVETLGRLLGLSEAEKAVVMVALAFDAFPSFKRAVAPRCEKTSTQRLAWLIGTLSGHGEDAVWNALRADAPLILTGVVTLDNRICDLEEKLGLMRGLGGVLLAPHARSADLVDRFLRRTEAPSLGPDDFAHLARDLEVLKDYLTEALRRGEPGVNVLFYGGPGTGKTELVKTLAAAVGAELYEIAFAGEDGEPIKGVERLRAYNLCQTLLARTPQTLLMFDEIEDVFPSRGGFGYPFGGGASSGSLGKAWINRALERNATPAVWVTNDAELDPAYLRRFDYSVRFPVPPQAVRVRIARHHFGEFEPPAPWLAAISASEEISPAQYERAAKVARIAGGGDPDRSKALAEQSLARSAALLGQRRLAPRPTRHTGYALEFLNTDRDVEKLLAGLRGRSVGTFCFYGPPGTGKSAFARHIADTVGRPLLVRRASDLLSKWVGETEQQIAGVFAEAGDQEAVLVLDEVDSLLADRAGASHRWEVTQTNELLTQIETFEGLLVCTTNRIDWLDPASLRRFAFKVKFDYLTPVQRWGLFCQELMRLGGKRPPAGTWEDPVRWLEGLTPGDFAVAARQFALGGGTPTAAELYEHLRAECEAKGTVRRPIGFCH